MKYLIVITALPTKKDARKICKIIIKKSLAACGQIIGPIESHYIWKNRAEQTKEYLCLIKTKENQYKSLEKMIKDNHPYQVPEIVAINISKGYKPYFDWIDKQILACSIRESLRQDRLNISLN